MWIQNIAFFALAIQSVICCYTREDVMVDNPRELVPEGHPTRMLGWEQMLLMFEDPGEATAEIDGYGLTERGALCNFKFRLGAKFAPGAGIIPTHGGFLMCGKNMDEDNSAQVAMDEFYCCYWANKRYAIWNHTCTYMASYMDVKYNENAWDGRLIMSTDKVLEQYQNTMYAFFQGSGEVYIGGIVWSNAGDWIINWVRLNTQNANPNTNPNWPAKDPCMVVIGTDMFMIAGTNTNGKRLGNTYGYRLNTTGIWFESMEYLTTARAKAACFVDKKTKDIFTVGGNVGGENKIERPTIEIGRYKASEADASARFIGYATDDCFDGTRPAQARQDTDPNNRTECFHTILKEGFASNTTMYGFQLDNDDGDKYKTVILGRRDTDETYSQPFNKTHNSTLKYMRAIRLHGDAEEPFPLRWESDMGEDPWEGLKNIGQDSFHIVPMRTIGFRPCVPRVPFRKHGKLVIPDPGSNSEYYSGYWWDKDANEQAEEAPEEASDKDEYYYYLNPLYEDT